jgi:hypothetical protein
MIGKDTGELRLSADLTISPSLTRDNFLSAPTSGKSTVLVENEPWISYSLEVELPGVEGHLDRWAAVIYFEGQTIDMVTMTLVDVKDEMERRKRHDSWLSSHLGPRSRYSFPWGKVSSEYDPRSSECSIYITYKKVKNAKPGKETLAAAAKGAKSGAASLPSVFGPDGERDKFIARMKKRASKNFKWSAARSLEDAMYLAYWFYLAGREEEALEVCAFLGQYQFEGNFNLWGWVEKALALQSRILRARGRADEIKESLGRIRSAGFVDDRLKGILLDGHAENVRLAAKDKDLRREAAWRAVMALEQCLIIEMGGSKTLPIGELEVGFQANLIRLKDLNGLSKA